LRIYSKNKKKEIRKIKRNTIGERGRGSFFIINKYE